MPDADQSENDPDLPPGTPFGLPATRHTIRKWVVPIFAVCTLLLLLPLGLSIWSFVERSRSFGQVQRTKDAQLQTAALLSLLQGAETAQRGYLLTGMDAYLTPFTDADDQIHKTLDALLILTRHDAEQQARVHSLTPLIEAKLEELRNTIALRREKGLDAALTVVETDQGKLVMDEMRGILTNIHRSQEEVLKRRLDVLARYSVLLVAAMITSIVLIVLAGGLAAFKVHREMHAREEALLSLNQFALHLNEANEALAMANGELLQFAYVASHDLQEPLRSISGYVQLLEKRYADKLDEKALGYIAKSVAAAKRMQVLIENLLSYSRIANAPQKFERVDTAGVVADAVADLEHRIRTANATVQRDTLPPVHGDRTQLTQLFRNLLGNAIKFRGPSAPSVHITVARHRDGSAKHAGRTGAGMWHFCVRDNGIGFDAEHGERIFLMFQRLHTREEYSGTGIGLALCKKIVERHGGRIWAEAKPGEGAAFHFTLPAAKG